MGIGGAQKKDQEIQKEVIFFTHTAPTTKNEVIELYSYESAVCKIIFETIKDGEQLKGCGTGFFCEISDKNIPFNKALFTNNHILDENSLQINEEIEIEYCEKTKIIEITKDRRVFTDKNLDYTCIEILDTDNINKFFHIDKSSFNDKKSLKNKEIMILQYPYGKLSHDIGKIFEIKNNRIEHSVSTTNGSSGSPLIKRYNNNLIIGIHFGSKKKDTEKSDESGPNYATPFDVIIKDIIDKLSKNTINIYTIIEYRNKINLIYYKDKNNLDYSNILFGTNFVKNNKDNIKLIINGIESNLIEKYELKESMNNVQLIINKPLTNLEDMFFNAKSLKNIEELKYLNTEKVNNFSYIFYGCSSLKDIKPIRNWNVSNGINFSYMLFGCSSLLDIKPLMNWNVSNGNNFSYMFCDCSSLKEIKTLRNWNVSNGINFSYMFAYCSSLFEIKTLRNWNVSNGKDFSYMFAYCSSIPDIKPIKNWNVSNGTNFTAMFRNCSGNKDSESLQNLISHLK